MEECVIIDFVRTPFSRSRPGKAEKDVFHKLRADDLAAMNIKEILKRTSVDATEIDDCLIGCALQLDENWLDGGRITSLVAGLPFNVPAMGMDRQCASSLSTIQIGAMEIMTGMANNELVIAGGMEHMTRIPMNMIAKVPV
ncbi:MAG: acetyl-CoA C-acyltransferase, partial [Candidatus Hodarchaeota archaeon]